MSTVTVSQLDDEIFQVKLDDAANQNRLTIPLCDELAAAFVSLAANQRVKVVLLTGTEEVFCAGASIEVLRSLVEGTLVVRDLVDLMDRIVTFPQPVIGALQGDAVGGGLMLGLYCDLAVAAAERRYGLNYTSLGFTPGMGSTSLVPELVGHRFATEMLLTGRFYRGEHLRDRGLFNEVVPACQVPQVSLDLARRMADKPRHVLQMVKETLAVRRRQQLHEAVSREDLMHRICFESAETGALIEERYAGTDGSSGRTGRERAEA